MDEIRIQNIRCFGDTGWVPLRPMTVLVGENSTGKTTFLAAIRMAWDLANGTIPIFNEAPFEFGTFDQIAHHVSGREGRTKRFAIGSRLGKLVEPGSVGVTSVFERRAADPALSSHEIDLKHLKLTGTREEDRLKPATSFKGKPVELGLLRQPLLRTMGYDSLDDLIAILSLALEEMRNGVGPPEDLSVLVGEYAEVSLQDEFGGRPFALAPVRSKPKRTYDPEEARPDSEGRHVPFALANVRGTRGRSKWEKLRKKIEPFGRESGLFDGVTVKRLGKSVNDPFQIQVNIQGLSRNLIDVGYGVSQVLPLLFEALSPDSPRTLLIQQPEVHLHPKAQAELATFMTALSKTTGNRFVVETHSDYFVNRMRTLIREKKTSVDDVAILYFERRKHDVKIHRLQIDELGNLIKPPRSYRQFFIKEAGRFLGVK